MNNSINNSVSNTKVAIFESPAFVATFRTTTPNETVTLPYQTTGTYSGVIEWGDGSNSPNSYDTRVHTYATSGDYVIKITGITRGFAFNNSGDRLKIINVIQFGNIWFGSGRPRAFYGCSNLSMSLVNDVPDLIGIENLDSTFRGCTSITNIPFINNWDMSSTISIGLFFSGATNFNDYIGDWNLANCTMMNSVFANTIFNQDISQWNVSKVTTFLSMFLGATAFNQNISSWNTSSCLNMSSMFQGATAFNQNIGNWNVSNVTNFSSFMFGKTAATYSAENLDAIYNGWSQRAVKPNISITFGTAKRTAASTVGRAILTSPPNNWTITDGGI